MHKIITPGNHYTTILHILQFQIAIYLVENSLIYKELLLDIQFLKLALANVLKQKNSFTPVDIPLLNRP